MAPRPRFDRRLPVRELPNINERITYPTLRVVDADGAQLGIISRDEALQVSRDRELDLVLVSEKANPPVCRVMDYGKFKFEQEKKAKEAKKKTHQTEMKEVKMRYKIDQHDYEVRIKQASRFLKAGDKVKCTVIFRGREIQHVALAEKLLTRLATDLEEQAEVQQTPKREGRNMIMFLTPRRTPLVKSKPNQQKPDPLPRANLSRGSSTFKSGQVSPGPEGSWSPPNRSINANPAVVPIWSGEAVPWF